MAQLANLLMDTGAPVVTRYNTLVQAATGTLVLSVAGSAHVTLTNNQAAHFAIELTGVLTGSINIIVPTKEKPYVIYNNTTGAFTITVKPVAGTGPQVAQGAHSTMYCNGTNVIELTTSIAGAGAPTTAQYLVAAADAGLTAERVATTTATISWDFGTAAQAKANIVAGSITYAMLQNSSAQKRIIARVNAGAGVYEEATVSDVLDFLTGAAQGDVLYRAGSVWALLAAGSSGEFLQTQGPAANPQWAAGAVGAPADAQYLVAATNGTLTAERVTTNTATITWDGATAGQVKADLVDGSVTYAKMVTMIADRLLGRDTSGTGAPELLALDTTLRWTSAPGIGRAEITGDVSVPISSNAATIVGGAVTLDKIQNMTASRVLGRQSSTGAPQQLTASEVLDFVGTTAQGNVLYKGGATWALLAPGTSGQFLQTLGAGANPGWAAIPADTSARTFANTSTQTAAANVTKLWAADTDGVADKSGLHIITENSVMHVLGSTLGIGVISGLSGMLHVRDADEMATTIIAETFYNSASGSAYNLRHARGTAASPLRLDLADTVGSLQMFAWARNAGDTANDWTRLSRIRTVVESKDGNARMGGRLEFTVGPGVSAAEVQAMALTEAGNMLLGTTTFGTAAAKIFAIGNGTAPTTSPANIVQLWAADRDGAAGKAGLYVRSETGTENVLADGASFGRLANGQALNFPEPLTELVTISAAATTTSSIQIPARAVVLGVSVRVTVTIPTAGNFDIGVAGATTRYGTSINEVAGSTNEGTNDGARYYATATSIVITPDLTPATNAGRVRLTIHYYSVTAPTS